MPLRHPPPAREPRAELTRESERRRTCVVLKSAPSRRPVNRMWPLPGNHCPRPSGISSLGPPEDHTGPRAAEGGVRGVSRAAALINFRNLAELGVCLGYKPGQRGARKDARPRRPRRRRAFGPCRRAQRRPSVFSRFTRRALAMLRFIYQTHPGWLPAGTNGIRL